MTLLAVPNVSEGRDRAVIEAIASAFDAQLLDVHCDPDHHRSVYTLAGAPGDLAGAVLAGAQAALEHIDLSRHTGLHPRVGALDVAPIVYTDEALRGAACAEALVLADRLGAELGLPVFLYGLLGGGRTRAELRRGGAEALGRRVDSGELRPDFGPRRLHARGGAVLVAARPPLIAFNVELEPPVGVQEAQQIAAALREGGSDGLTGVRAIGLRLEQSGRAQVSMNVEDPGPGRLAEVVAAIERHHPIAEAELVGLAPRRAFDGFPEGIRVRNRKLLEDELADTNRERPH